MNQLAYSPGPFHQFAPAASATTAYHQQPAAQGSGYYPQGHNQAFAYPGQHQQQQQLPYHDGVSSGFQQQHMHAANNDGSPPPSSTGGGMMQPPYAALQQQQQQQQHYTHYPSSTAASPHALSAPTPQLPTPPNSTARQSASPQRRLSPNAAGQVQAKSHSQTPPIRYPMAAPPLPQSPASTSQHGSASTSTALAASPKTPQSPSSGPQTREQQRVALLLDINVTLLAEVNRLQGIGKGGAVNPAQMQQLAAAGQPADMASEEYIQTLRRVQANLAYLMKAQPGGNINNNNSNSSNESKVPALMTPPAHMPQLRDKYDQLRELFPDWQALLEQHRVQSSGGGGGTIATASSPRANVQQGNANGIATAPQQVS